MLSYKTVSASKTQKLAGLLAKEVLKTKPGENAMVLVLTGDLGTGKTTFTQGFLRALGIKKKIASPTFVLFKRFKIRKNLYPNSCRFANVYHIDCYRIKKPSELLKLGLREILNNPQNIVLIEWAEKIKKILPKNMILIKFRHGVKENIRIIRIHS